MTSTTRHTSLVNSRLLPPSPSPSPSPPPSRHSFSSVSTISLVLLAFILAILTTAPTPVMCVKKHDFKTCSQSGFCTRQRAYADLLTKYSSGTNQGESFTSPYTFNPSSIQFDAEKAIFKATLSNTVDKKDFSLVLEAVDSAASFRLRMNEIQPLHPRWEGVSEFSLIKSSDLTATKLGIPLSTSQLNDSSAFVTGSVKFTQRDNVFQFKINDSKSVKIFFKPFSIEFIVNSETVAIFNERNFFHFEHYRRKPEAPVVVPAPVEVASANANANENGTDTNGTTSAPPKSEFEQLSDKLVEGSWEESFNSKPDTKPKGPASLGIDITFPGAAHVFGLPEHASSFNLKNTRGGPNSYSEPYRLYNLDVFEYELNSPMALYGSIPFMMAHKTVLGKGSRTVGVLFLNAAEMWVDVERTGVDAEKLHSQPREPSAFTTTPSKVSTQTHFMVESGIVDLFFFFGPSPKEVLEQYAVAVGTQALPPLWAQAYHQCRWNYLDEADVFDVDKNFDKYDIPYDVLWLDIEHTDGKRYFTWDSSKFPNPVDMQKRLDSNAHRKMVTIIDPHLKKDDNYHVSKEAGSKQLFVRDKDGKDFEGWCWPGNSGWLDYLKPEARQYWAECFAYDKYQGSSPTLFTWNDMNEPSVFTGPEITMPKDNLHGHNDIEHRDVHNVYGMVMQAATYEGQLYRQQTPSISSNPLDKMRPFVLSRAFFVGTQRYGAIWTGDNMADWGHLKASVPMLLSVGVGGISFAGADVGGFFNNPSAELVLRWYQAGVFQPFLRNHAHIDTKRREPWVFGEPTVWQIREAVQKRYRLLPQWYTWFWISHVYGLPAMRPLWMEFGNDERTFGEEESYLLGEEMLVAPVLDEHVTEKRVVLPKQATWYDYDTGARVSTLESVTRGSEVQVLTPLTKVPVFVRGGKILVTKERVRRSASLMYRDPITLTIYVDPVANANASATVIASGRVFLDDYETFRYENGEYLDLEISLERSSSTKKKYYYIRSKSLRSGDLKALSEEVLKKLSTRVERIVVLGLDGVVESVKVNSKVGSKVDAEVMNEVVAAVKDVQGEGVWRKETKKAVIKNPPGVVLGEDWEVRVKM